MATCEKIALKNQRANMTQNNRVGVILSMGLVILIIGLVLFIAPHVLVSLRDIRAKLIAWLGERPTRA